MNPITLSSSSPEDQEIRDLRVRITQACQSSEALASEIEKEDKILAGLKAGCPQKERLVENRQYLQHRAVKKILSAKQTLDQLEQLSFSESNPNEKDSFQLITRLVKTLTFVIEGKDANEEHASFPEEWRLIRQQLLRLPRLPPHLEELAEKFNQATLKSLFKRVFDSQVVRSSADENGLNDCISDAVPDNFKMALPPPLTPSASSKEIRLHSDLSEDPYSALGPQGCVRVSAEIFWEKYFGRISEVPLRELMPTFFDYLDLRFPKDYHDKKATVYEEMERAKNCEQDMENKVRVYECLWQLFCIVSIHKRKLMDLSQLQLLTAYFGPIKKGDHDFIRKVIAFFNDNYRWFHGYCLDPASVLKPSQALLRFSNKVPGTFVISFKNSSDVVIHYRVVLKESRFNCCSGNQDRPLFSETSLAKLYQKFKDQFRVKASHDPLIYYWWLTCIRTPLTLET